MRGLDQRINWGARAICIEGARGTGKSTLMLQHIQKNLPREKTLYISLDDIYFREHTFSEVADAFYKQGGRYLFADEVHKYPNWQQEVKNTYDFFPDLQLVVSGSSILALQQSQADLSRRLLRYQLTELSFREFIALKEGVELSTYSLKVIISEPNVIVAELLQKIPSPLKLFAEYLAFGAYPFFVEGEEEFLIRVNQLINVIIDYDLPEAKTIETATQAKLKKLLYIVSTSVPFKPNIAKLAVQLGTSRARLLELLHLLEKAQLLHNLRSGVFGTSLMNKPEKIFLRNTSLIMALAEGKPNKGNLRETFFLSQLVNAGHKVTYPKTGDFRVDEKYLFEIGGKNKTRKQIIKEEQAFIAADDIEYGFGQKIPLWLFGFLY
ncbi:MAG TPA: AAA family ATPase [Aequorivita sp.]|nr:AAA family ATPase [Aequorivita sp.]